MSLGYFDKFNRKGIPFMEGAERKLIKDILDTPVHIVDYGYIDGKDGKFACMKLAEYDGAFFFGNVIITDMLMEIDKDGMKEELANQAIVFSERISKESNREYIAFEFVEA